MFFDCFFFIPAGNQRASHVLSPLVPTLLSSDLLGFLVASLVAGRLVPRYGAWVLTLGALVGAVGFAWLGAVGIEDTAPALPTVAVVGLRTEEHTSELQSLMRISYAVFCWKKKKRNNAKYTYDVKA